MQVIGIILVVAGHSLHLYPDGFYGDSLFAHHAIYSFHMHLFMFVSGFLMVYTTQLSGSHKKTATQFIKDKFLRLILPFITLTLITFIPRSMMSGIADDPIRLDVKSFLLSFVHMDYLIIPYFWYLHASFVILVGTFCVFFITRKLGLDLKWSVWILLIGFFILAFISTGDNRWFSTVKIEEFWLYFIIGCGYCLYSFKIDKIIPWTNVYLLFFFISMWLLSLVFLDFIAQQISAAIFGILMCISAAKMLEKYEWRFLDHLTGANYLIFLLSWYCNVLCQQVLSHFISMPWWVHSLLSLVSGIYVPWLAYRYLLNHPDSRWVRVTAFLLGQKLPKTKKTHV